jgi:prophage regulatory protein
MSAGHFPRPVKIGVAAVAWVEDEVDEWIASRISERETTKCGTTIIYDWNKD